MTNTELLKTGRDRLLSLHKSLVDHERWAYEEKNGKVTSGQFLNLLLESPDLAWLRMFSSLIVEIDEMFAQKDGFTEEAVETHLDALRRLVQMQEGDEQFIARYQEVLQNDSDAAAKQADLKHFLAEAA